MGDGTHVLYRVILRIIIFASYHFLRRAFTNRHHRGPLEIIETPLPGVLLIQPCVFEDPRGFFMETYRADKLAAAGVHETFVQDNHSRSARGVLRGLHFQLRHPQAKLCRVSRGEVFDVAVDIRVGSPYYGKWVGAVLSDENRHALYLPKGFAHGFVVRSDFADFLYKCSDYYDAADDCGVLWNDPALAIDWDEPSPIISAKDLRNMPLSQVSRERLPVYKP
jgi:dTDP-4-dehydrorhamnose 3,5-epimerase